MKTKKILISLSIFLMLVMPIFSFAQSSAPVMKISNLTATSVTINATGLIPNQAYTFRISLSSFRFVVASSTGKASGSFDDLTEGTTYTVSLDKEDVTTGTQSPSGASSLKFTANNPVMKTSNLTATSVTINATGLIPNQAYIFKIVVIGDEVLVEQAVASSTGKASGSFSNLTTRPAYTVNLYKFDPPTTLSPSGAPSLSFTMPIAHPAMTYSNLTATSVKINATELIPNQVYIFKILVSADEVLAEQAVASSTGKASGSFSNLTTLPAYTVSLYKFDPPTTLLPSGAPDLSFTMPRTPPTCTPPLTNEGGVCTCKSPNKLEGGVCTPPPPPPGGDTGPDTYGGGLVPCENKCDFNDLMGLINKVIHFILFDLVIPIAAIMFAYAGIVLITAGGESAHAKTKAKNIFSNAIIGLILAVGAFLIIRTILSILGYQGSWIGFNPLG